jgi:hypothetical protein
VCNDMTKEIKILILIAALWVFLQIVEYYVISTIFLIGGLWWLGLLLATLIIPIYQIIRLIMERKNLKKIRIIKVCFWASIFYVTCFVSVASIIEKADWHILYSKRMEIVEKVKKRELNPNVSWNDYLCELPYKFPIVSKSGNDITIRRNHSTQAVTVEFFIVRGMLSPSSYFIYTDDDERINYYESIINKSDRNWKIKENWYRIRE